jgi:SRSO17 transposase
VRDDQPVTVLRRLMQWLEPFKSCFGHRAQVLSLAQYVEGLLSDSPRKSMQAMLGRLTDPRPYQAFHHFVTDAPWDAAAVWRRLLAVLPERRGFLILDDTGFPKQGTHSVGVARQYSGTLGKIGNCQIAVTAALWTRARAWLVGAELYLPDEWLSAARRAEARIPASRGFAEKWRLALALLRRVRAAGIAIDGVLADAAYGDVTLFRTALDRLGLSYVVGLSCTTTVWPGTPPTRPVPAGRAGRPRKRPLLDAPAPVAVAALASAAPADAWRRIEWRNGEQPPWAAEFLALRVTPAVEWRRYHRVHTLWLLCERNGPSSTRTKYYLSNLPPRTSLTTLVRWAHHRWAIEQQYQELKTEIGLDHFEGRTYPGWHHHMVISAITYAFLQAERLRRRPTLTFPAIHAVVQEVFAGLLFVSRPKYLKWLNQARELYPLRI